MHPTVTVLGVGAMGEALVAGLLAAGWAPGDIATAVRRESLIEVIEARFGCTCTLDPARAAAGKNVVVVAVKPRDVRPLLELLEGTVEREQVVVSLAAGIPIEEYERVLGPVPVVRAMPNTPALVGEGVTGIAAGRYAQEVHVERACAVLGAVGSVEVLEESLLDAVTAVSGTGPAYVFLLAEALVEAAIREGLPRDIAEGFVYRTIKGSGHLLTETGQSPAHLRAQVTSPGGTTAAAMHVLEERGFRALVEDAVRAAARRSRQLGLPSTDEEP